LPPLTSSRGGVRRASSDETVAVAGLLGRGFATDPIERWCLACDDPTALIELELLQATRQLTAAGWLWVTDDLSGAAAWLPPGAGYDDEAIDAVVNPELARRGGRPDRLTRFWTWVDDHRPTPPHWYLDLVAVEPERHNAGIGHRLLVEGLVRVDRSARAGFLVTGNPRTVPWYERHGFAVRSEEQAPDAGPTVWFMERPPRGHAPGSVAPTQARPRRPPSSAAGRGSGRWRRTPGPLPLP
jgi:GNAT superfamily N-acetyltransferase